MDTYEKKYKEALERAEGVIEQNPLMEYLKKGIEYIFPELKESEDEKIRKELISLVENWKIFNPNSPFDEHPVYTSDKDTVDKILAWLEKQGEQKNPVKIKAPEESLNIDSKTYNEIVNDCIFGEDKPKFKVGDSIKTTNEQPLTITKIDDKGYWSENLFICGFGDAAKWELVEQKSVWSEEDEERLKSCLNILQAKGLMGVTDTINSNWLKSLKERIQHLEWNSEKKELKKISQRMISAEAKEAMYSKPTDLEEFINELSKQFPDVSFAKLSRIAVRVAKWANKPCWSEENKKHIIDIIDYLDDYYSFAKDEYKDVADGVLNEIRWLQSI